MSLESRKAIDNPIEFFVHFLKTRYHCCCRNANFITLKIVFSNAITEKLKLFPSIIKSMLKKVESLSNGKSCRKTRLLQTKLILPFSGQIYTLTRIPLKTYHFPTLEICIFTHQINSTLKWPTLRSYTLFFKKS